MERAIQNLDELQSAANDFIQSLTPSAEGATLVTLSGELGAGKTAFVQACARALGIEDAITSPTFVLEKVYPLSTSTFTRLIHIDAYRLQGGSELAPLRLEDDMKDAKNLVMLEWPERVVDALPKATVAITLVPHEDGTRTLTYDKDV